MDSDRSIILLCPGQGAQYVGMGRAWAEASEAAAHTFREADEALGLELSALCFSGPAEKLNRTDVAQAAIYVTSVACWRGLEAAGRVRTDDVAAAAGLSLGEYTALHLAGVFSFRDGLELVVQRGRFMQEAAEAGDSGMVALIGADAEGARAVCEAARGDGILVEANFNCPGQIVLSGSSDACERALAAAERQQVRASALPVAGAFHSPLMEPAARRMAEVLASVPFQPPRVPVLSNVTGAPHDTDPDRIRRFLVDQITQPVLWEQNVRDLLAGAAGGSRFVELAPGKVLGGLMRRIDRSRRVENFDAPPDGPG